MSTWRILFQGKLKSVPANSSLVTLPHPVLGCHQVLIASQPLSVVVLTQLLVQDNLLALTPLLAGEKTAGSTTVMLKDEMMKVVKIANTPKLLTAVVTLFDAPVVETVAQPATSTPAVPVKVDLSLVDESNSFALDDVLVCKICLTSVISHSPISTKCNHYFCGDCFALWVSVQPSLQSWAKRVNKKIVSCPVCKQEVAEEENVLIDGGLEVGKKLSKVPIKCPCSWTGDYDSYVCKHAKDCSMREEAKDAGQLSTATATGSVECYIPFQSDQEIPGTIRVGIKEKVLVTEHNNQWVYGRSVEDPAKEGWFPEYCIKTYNAFYENLYEDKLERVAITKQFVSQSKEDGMSVSEGEVLILLSRHENSWNLCVSSDGTQLGYVPDNRCKIIRDAQGGVEQSVGAPHVVNTFVAKHGFEAEGERELSIHAGDIVSVRQTHSSGWTLGVVVAGGKKSQGWFPDWVLDKGKERCCNCDKECTPVGTVKLPGKAEPGVICSGSCWEKWIRKLGSK
jgi:SH3 domain/Zinc finger, C3HC4 type (RING finger)